MDSVPGPSGRRRRLNPIPEPLIPDAPTGPPIAASPGSPGRREPPQESSPQPPISATPAFNAFPDPPARHRPPQEPSPQPPISATPAAAAAAVSLGLTISTTPTAAVAASPGPPGCRGSPQEPSQQPPISATPAFAASPDPQARPRPPQEPSPQGPQPPISAATTAAAAASPGPPGLQPPRNPIPQTPTAFSDPVTLLIKDWADCRALFSPGGAKIVAIISMNFSQRDLPLLEDLMKEELARPQELQGFVVANPEIIPELRKKRARPLAMLRADPKGLHRPPHQPSPQPRISVVPAAAASPDTPILQPHPDLIPLSPPTPSDPPPTASDPPPTPPHPPPFLIKDHEYCRALTSAGCAKIVAVISPQFPLEQLPVLEATIATESNKPQESQSFVVRNPEILSELRKRRELLLTTAWELDSKITECNKLVCQMNEIKGNIQSVDGLSLAGIDRQIEIVAGFIGSLRRARLDLQRKHRI